MENKLQIPYTFQKILELDQKLYGAVLNTIADFSDILYENKLFFFEEYTDHGIDHVQKVMRAAEEIIAKNTLNNIVLFSTKDVCVLVLSIILHDLGMHISFEMFKNMIDGKYDNCRIPEFDEKTWRLLWGEYMEEARRFSGKQRIRIFGNEDQEIRPIKLKTKDDLTGYEKKLIGEFIRRHHPRIAHEIAYKGLIDKNGDLINFIPHLDEYKEIKKLAGLVARSHGIEIRDTFEYLKTFSEDEWASPYSINVVFLMVVLRIADFFQFDKSRVSEFSLKFKTFSSPISELEHLKHLAIEFVKQYNKDNETLLVEARPSSSYLYLLFRMFRRAS